jgi:hypothetical protein
MGLMVMASQKQLEANRANANRSAGPKTAEGKRRSRLNALKHGLSARDIVVWDEDPLEFEDFRAKVEADLSPVGIIQYELTDRAAGLLWRLRRMPKLEAAHLEFDIRGTCKWLTQTPERRCCNDYRNCTGPKSTRTVLKREV